MDTTTPTTALRHRHTCGCADPAPRANGVDRRICQAHGTASHLAKLAIAAACPATHLAGHGEDDRLMLDPLGLKLYWDIRDVEWLLATQRRRECADAGSATFHLDVYLSVVAELLPARQRRALDAARRRAAP